MPSPKYTRVKDKRTRHEYDVLETSFNPEKHELVTKGPYAGTSSYPRRVKLNVKKSKASAPKTSGEPSGDNQEEKEELTNG